MDTIVYNVEGKEKGRYELPGFFSTEVKTALLHEVTTGYLANLRSGTHATKTRGEVSFSGAKPWKQKGTGNARAGQKNSPLWRKGGIVFGPVVRDHSHDLTKKFRKLGLKTALSAKAQEGSLVIIDECNKQDDDYNITLKCSLEPIIP